MKKLMLSMMVLIAIMASSVFGMYSPDSDWVDFLTHGNQLRARVEQFGITIGNGTIKGTFGFKGNNVIFVDDGGPFQFTPTASAGIGYTSDAVSVGLGYSYTYKNKNLSTHTPVLMLNFLDNNLRIVVPVSIAMTDKSSEGFRNYKYTGISTDTHIRYYTGMDAFSQIRLYIKYGMNEKEYTTALNSSDDKIKSSTSSLGVDFRAYFGANVDELALAPFIRVTYDTALNAKGKIGTTSYRVTAADEFGVVSSGSGIPSTYDRDPYAIQVLPTLGITASTDIVTVYVEPGLGYRAADSGLKGDKLRHALAWNAYGEIYLTPLPNLEWYFEVDAGSKTDPNTSQEVSFATSTGVTWYLPDLQ